MSPGQLNSLRFLLSNVISTNNHPQKSFLFPSQKSVLLELNSALNFMATKVDRGDQTVLHNKSDYIPHVKTLKKDPSTEYLKEVKRDVENSVVLTD